MGRFLLVNFVSFRFSVLSLKNISAQSVSKFQNNFADREMSDSEGEDRETVDSSGVVFIQGHLSKRAQGA